MKSVFTLALEGRRLPEHTEEVNGQPVLIPAHWTILAVFGGVDPRGVVRMWSTDTGLVHRGENPEGLRPLFHEAARAFPLDGRDLRVQGRYVCGRLRGAGGELRDYHLWVPPKDIFSDGYDVVEVTGTVVGLGIGLETRKDTRDVEGNRAVFLAPYYATLVYEEFEDGRKVPIVVPVRWMAPWDEKTRLVEDDEPLTVFLPKIVRRMQDRARIGSSLTVHVRKDPTPHYYLEGIVAPDTIMGAAVKGAGLDNRAFPEAPLKVGTA